MALPTSWPTMPPDDRPWAVPLDALDGNEQRQVKRTLSADSLEEARDIVLRLGVPGK